MSEGNADNIKSLNPKENRMLEVDSNIEISDSRQRTSSDLMYCEYINASGSERVNKLFEKKKEKPVMVSYGESPFYKKYSDLLRTLEESQDVLPSESDEQLPIIEMEVFLKQNVDEDSDTSDIEDSRIIFCGEKDDSTTDEEPSENDDDNIDKMGNKVQIISKETEHCLEQEQLRSSDLTRVNSSAENCELSKSCISVSGKNNSDSLPNYEPVPKKFRLD